MAEHYVREIRTIQPHGPYHLCAFSDGGLIIFEMARQMRGLGEPVTFVGLLDAYGPDYPEYLSLKTRVAHKISVNLNTRRVHEIKGQVGDLFRRIRDRVGLIASQLFGDLLLRLGLPMPRRTRYEYVTRLIELAAQNYPRGNTYVGDVVLFRAASQPKGIKPDRTLGWGELIKGDLKIVDVVGTHHSIIMRAPHLAELVQKIDAELRQLHNPLPAEPH
jgi:aspartate racemase